MEISYMIMVKNLLEDVIASLLSKYKRDLPKVVLIPILSSLVDVS